MCPPFCQVTVGAKPDAVLAVPGLADLPDRSHINTPTHGYLPVDISALDERDTALCVTAHEPELRTQVPASHFPALTQTLDPHMMQFPKPIVAGGFHQIPNVMSKHLPNLPQFPEVDVCQVWPILVVQPRQ